MARGLGHVPQFIAQRAARYRILDLGPLPGHIAAHRFLHLPKAGASHL
jgi:hypothetical protein